MEHSLVTPSDWQSNSTACPHQGGTHSTHYCHTIACVVHTTLAEQGARSTVHEVHAMPCSARSPTPSLQEHTSSPCLDLTAASSESHQLQCHSESLHNMCTKSYLSTHCLALNVPNWLMPCHGPESATNTCRLLPQYALHNTETHST